VRLTHHKRHLQACVDLRTLKAGSKGEMRLRVDGSKIASRRQPCSRGSKPLTRDYFGFVLSVGAVNAPFEPSEDSRLRNSGTEHQADVL
jgi:hypothetical protein